MTDNQYSRAGTALCDHTVALLLQTARYTLNSTVAPLLLRRTERLTLAYTTINVCINSMVVAKAAVD